MSTASLRLRIYDGARQPFSRSVKLLVRVIDGMQNKQVEKFYSKSELLFDELPFYDNFGDNYTLLVSADGYRDAGFFPVKLSDRFTQTVDIMLVPRQPGFSFANATWSAARAAYSFLSTDASDAAAAKLYGNLAEQKLPLACMLNLFEAAADIPLQQGTPLDYIKAIFWSDPYAPQQDRLFCWGDAALVNQMRIGESAGLFAEVPSILHPGATHSWKELRNSEADLQLTFHEKDKLTVDGVKCVMLELDIDYYSDPVAHTLLEVVPNGIAHTLTNPVEVYILRWMAGRRSKSFEFAPLYTLTDSTTAARQPAAAARPAAAKTLKRRRTASGGKTQDSARARS
jgi:hypothetical protein